MINFLFMFPTILTNKSLQNGGLSLSILHQKNVIQRKAYQAGERNRKAARPIGNCFGSIKAPEQKTLTSSNGGSIATTNVCFRRKFAAKAGSAPARARSGSMVSRANRG